MKARYLLLAAGVMATVAAAQELSWQDLVQRSDLWPAQCTVKQTIKFTGGVTVQAGQKVDVLAFKANEVELKTTDGRTNFAAEPDETDVVELARAAYAKLTPKQRALTYPAIVQQKDLAIGPQWLLVNGCIRSCDAGSTKKSDKKNGQRITAPHNDSIL